MSPTYYIDGDYEKVSVRIYAENAPVRDASFNIYDDGTSIFDNNRVTDVHGTKGTITITDDTNVYLLSGDNGEEIADRFNDTVIDEGSWVYCDMVDAGGGSNYSVQLELSLLD